jgi:hypothetical protein
MSVPRTVAEVLADHVTLEVEGIDRMYLNVYVPDLQRTKVWPASFDFTAAISLSPAP